MNPTRLIALLAWVATVLLAGCTGVPDGINPVRGFELERYLGAWHVRFPRFFVFQQVGFMLPVFPHAEH
jgi:lipocalin